MSRDDLCLVGDIPVPPTLPFRAACEFSPPTTLFHSFSLILTNWVSPSLRDPSTLFIVIVRDNLFGRFSPHWSVQAGIVERLILTM